MPAFTLLCFLSGASCSSLACCHHVPAVGGLHPQTMSPNKIFLPQFFVRYSVIAAGEVVQETLRLQEPEPPLSHAQAPHGPLCLQPRCVPWSPEGPLGSQRGSSHVFAHSFRVVTGLCVHSREPDLSRVGRDYSGQLATPYS